MDVDKDHEKLSITRSYSTNSSSEAGFYLPHAFSMKIFSVKKEHRRLTRESPDGLPISTIQRNVTIYLCDSAIVPQWIRSVAPLSKSAIQPKDEEKEQYRIRRSKDGSCGV